MITKTDKVKIRGTNILINRHTPVEWLYDHLRNNYDNYSKDTMKEVCRTYIEHNDCLYFPILKDRGLVIYKSCFHFKDGVCHVLNEDENAYTGYLLKAKDKDEDKKLPIFKDKSRFSLLFASMNIIDIQYRYSSDLLSGKEDYSFEVKYNPNDRTILSGRIIDSNIKLIKDNPDPVFFTKKYTGASYDKNQ